jgi:hypothetical protein
MDSAVVAVEVYLASVNYLWKLSIRRTQIRVSSVFTLASPSVHSSSTCLQSSSLSPSAAPLAFTSRDSRTYNTLGCRRKSHAIVRPSSTTLSQVGSYHAPAYKSAPRPGTLLTDMPSLQLTTFASFTTFTTSPSRPRITPPSISPWPLQHAHTRSKSSSPTPHSSNGTATFAMSVPIKPCTNASNASSRHVRPARPSHRSVPTALLRDMQLRILPLCMPQIRTVIARHPTSNVRCQMCLEERFFGRSTFMVLTR